MSGSISRFLDFVRRHLLGTSAILIGSLVVTGTATEFLKFGVHRAKANCEYLADRISGIEASAQQREILLSIRKLELNDLQQRLRVLPSNQRMGEHERVDREIRQEQEALLKNRVTVADEQKEMQGIEKQKDSVRTEVESYAAWAGLLSGFYNLMLAFVLAYLGLLLGTHPKPKGNLSDK